jgi:hypothetical protein
MFRPRHYVYHFQLDSRFLCRFEMIFAQLQKFRCVACVLVEAKGVENMVLNKIMK